MLSAIQFGGFASRIFWGWTADRIGSGFALRLYRLGVFFSLLFGRAVAASKAGSGQSDHGSKCAEFLLRQEGVLRGRNRRDSAA